VSLFSAAWRVVLEINDSVSRSVLLEVSEEFGVVLVFAGLGNGYLFVVGRSFVDNVVKSVGLFDLVKGLLALRRDGCESPCHNWNGEMEEERGEGGRPSLFIVKITPAFCAGMV
jgi:hypothetical protein